MPSFVWSISLLQSKKERKYSENNYIMAITIKGETEREVKVQGHESL